MIVNANQHRSTSYGCAESWECDAFGIENNGQLCSNVSFQACTFKSCDHVTNTTFGIPSNDTIISSNVSFFAQKQCCNNGNNCNHKQNLTNEQCTLDENNNRLFGEYNTEYLQCLSSKSSLFQTYSQYRFCGSNLLSFAQFMNDHQYCEFVASYAYVELGCQCQSLTFLWNKLSNIDQESDSSSMLNRIYASLTRRIDTYRESIDDFVNVLGYCCDIDFVCNLNDKDETFSSDGLSFSAYDVVLTWYFVEFNILVNYTNRLNYDHNEMVDIIATELSIFNGEISIENEIFIQPKLSQLPQTIFLCFISHLFTCFK